MGRGTVTISKKHGVNPTLLICPICHKETGGLALLGKLKGDAEAPKYTMDHSLCKECQSAVDAGAVLLIEVRDGEENNKNPYRTGKIVGIKRSAIDPESIGDSPAAFIPESDLKDMMGDMYGKQFNNLGGENDKTEA